MQCQMCNKKYHNLTRYVLPTIQYSETFSEASRRISIVSETQAQPMMICWKCAAEIAEKIGEMKNDKG